MVRDSFIRSATLSGFVQACHEASLNPIAMLKRVGLKPTCLQSPDLLISRDAFVRLLEVCAEESGFADFGARAAIARGVPDLGPVSLLLREAETIEDALQIMQSRLHLHGDGTNMTVDVSAADPVIHFRIEAPRHQRTTQATEFCVCGMTQVVRWLIGSHWKPLRVCFTHASRGQQQTQRAFFQAPVWYGQRISGLVIEARTLRRHVVISAPFLRRIARRYLEANLVNGPERFSDKVAEVIVQRLARHSCTIEDVAQILGVNRRTVARRLQRDGKSYSELLQTARRKLAVDVAADRGISLTEAAGAMGFHNLSSFSRWFRQTYGCSPSEWRQGAAMTANEPPSRRARA